MAIETHKIPMEDKNEDKWFKFFTIGQLIAIIGQLLIDVLIYKFFSKFGGAIVGVFFALMFTILAGIVIMGKMPPSKYLLGSGLPFYVIIGRLIFHKINHKTIYVRNYNTMEENLMIASQTDVLTDIAKTIENKLGSSSKK